jgi:MarR family 2-MHQ and catechol resistance regulon transcriptional repressor
MASGVRLWLIVWRAYETLREHAHRHIRSLGLGLSDFAVLETLLHKGPTPVNTIGQRVRLTSGAITAAVDRLESKGLVERKSDSEDRRTRVVHLTSAGRQLIECAFADHARAMDIATSGLSDAEREQAVELLKKMGLRGEEILRQV